MKCRICGNNKNNQTFKAKEMMFGTQETFTYFECSCCGCLQISEIPEDMSKYYPHNYYLSSQPKTQKKHFKILKKYILLNRRITGKCISLLFPYSVYNWLKNTHVNFNSRILEVGCGVGGLLLTLHDYGFKNVLGVDPYIGEEIINDDVKILKSTIHELSDSQMFDLIIFNHSFEHIPDQLETLLKISKILSEKGVCLIRMPVKTKYIWDRYGVNWVQIDAPRHFFIHTIKSFTYLAKKAGLLIKDNIFDSNEFLFWGSEQYKRGFPLRAENSYLVNRKKSIFTEKQIKKFREMAKELNKNNQGDQAAFYLSGV
jgi:SAM-dependent methyltransferase